MGHISQEELRRIEDEVTTEVLEDQVRVGLELFRQHPTDKRVSDGVVDSHDHLTESVEAIKKRVRTVL